MMLLHRLIASGNEQNKASMNRWMGIPVQADIII